jgi:hypothetical protein
MAAGDAIIITCWANLLLLLLLLLQLVSLGRSALVRLWLLLA